ncbi:MAG: TRM11 family SAM-dependent methyltransferase [Candidatus Dormibacteria bacterium]
MKLFLMGLPGLASLMSREASAVESLTVRATGFDGRSDVVFLDAKRSGMGDAVQLRLSEDVFIELGRAHPAARDTPRLISQRLWSTGAVEKALSHWVESGHILRGAMTFRVITRVLHEASFRRTDLRTAMERVIGNDRRRWRRDDPSELEVWVIEYATDAFVAGLRLSDSSMRQHAGRAVERHGALRPTLAAAMVRLAGDPPGTILDPFCGSGTILSEALSAGWSAVGFDIDAEAVAVARQNAPAARIAVGDAQSLDVADASIQACVSNLPFGRQFGFDGAGAPGLGQVLNEMTRATRPGGRVVVVAPRIARADVPSSLRPAERFELRLLGMRTALWAYDRRPNAGGGR